MPEQATSAGPRPPAAIDDSELRTEVERQHAEILRLRDLLVHKDAELGVAKGRLAELDERSQRTAALAMRIEALVPGLGRLVATAMRVLRGQRH